MSAPVLSITEQKAAVSGKKKKKKTMKNVLDIPNNLKIEVNVADLNEAEKLSEILERLLPSARLPIKENPTRESKEETPEETKQKAEIKYKRNQLSLGVNALSRNIKKSLISAALIAADVQPKFLVHHLNLLCTHNKVPFLEMPELRKITKKCLGFPCIAVGFKRDFSDFSEAVNEIRLVSQNKVKNGKEIDNESSSEESEESEIEEIPGQCEEIAFSYLHRSSTKERVFIPESINNVNRKPEGEFITLGKDDETGLNCNKLGISSNLVRKQKKRGKKFEKFKSAEEDDDDDDDDDDEDLEVPKKKIKKDWVIDKVGTRVPFYPAKLMRVSSNPDRHRKK